MSIVDDLIASIVERNTLRVNGRLSIRLVDGGVAISGTVATTLRDQKKNKDILNVNIPVDADVRVGEIVIPVPQIP